MTESQQMPKGKIIDFTQLEEGWSLYRLDDGNFLRVKIIITKILRTEQRTPEGLPVYIFQTTNAVGTFSPQEMVSLRPKVER